MAYYNFRKDLKQSQVGVDVVTKHIKSMDGNWEVKELDRPEQHKGDIRAFKYTGMGNVEGEFTVEIKFDIMAEETGNLCFEASNGKKATGVLSTEANEIWYVVPNSENFVIYKFITKDLVDFLNNPSSSDKIRTVRGGDRRKFTLMLVKRELAKELVSYETVSV